MLTHLQGLPAFLDAVRDPAKWFLQLISGAIGKLVDSARDDVGHVLDRYLFTTVDTSTGTPRAFTDNASLRRLNLAMAVAADIVMGAVVLYAALRSMFERSIRSQHGIRLLLPRLLLAMVFVHLSLPLMQMAIDLDNALSRVALSLGDELHVDGLPWSPVIAPDAVQHISATQDLFHGVLAVVVVVALVILVLAYVLRHAILAVLIVLAPAAGLLTALPETREWSRTWLRLFTVTVFMQPVQLVVLRVAMVVGIDDGGGGLVQTLDALATLFVMLKVPGAMNSAAHLETKAETWAKHIEKAARKAALKPFHHASSHASPHRTHSA